MQITTQFALSEKQQAKFDSWREEQDRKAAALQVEKRIAPDARASLRLPDDVPYYGAIGGAYTYCFTPTGIGTAVKVRNDVTGDEIDLTNHEEW